ncbi:MAG: hypothetical protein ACRDHE_13170, partial [Ktedonobacterales bacterium]
MMSVAPASITGESAPAASSGYTETRANVSRLYPWIAMLGWLIGFALLFVAYLYATRTVGNNSDNASVILEGQAMAHGNLLLRGWYLPPDSFITTEAALDALGGLLFSPAQLLKLTPAFLYASASLLAAYLAGRTVTEPAARWLASVACVALIAFPNGSLLVMVMQGPMHFGTIVASLIAWLAYDRFVTHPASRGMLAAFALVTTLAIIGDPMAEALIVLPALIVGVWALWRSGGRDVIARATTAGAAVALLLGVGLRQALIATGTFIGSATPQLASPGLIWRHAQWLCVEVCMFFHIDLRHGVGSGQWIVILALNCGVLILCCAGFVRLLRRSLTPGLMRDSLSGVLSWAIVSSVAAFLFTDFAVDFGGTRYLLPAFIYAGILCYPACARMLAGRRLKRFIVTFLCASGLVYVVALAQTPRATAPEQPLIAFLESHHLTAGYGSYWTANISTLRN